MNLSVQGVDLLLPDPTDQLLLACLRRRALADVERVRWALETCAILLDAEQRLNEGALDERAGGAGVSEECAESLRTISAIAGEQLPAVRTLRVSGGHAGRTRVSAQRRAPRQGAQRVARAAADAVRRYSGVCRSEGSRATPWGFLRFTAAFYGHEWGVRDVRGLAAAAVRRFRAGSDSVALGAL